MRYSVQPQNSGKASRLSRVNSSVRPHTEGDDEPKPTDLVPYKVKKRTEKQERKSEEELEKNIKAFGLRSSKSFKDEKSENGAKLSNGGKK